MAAADPGPIAVINLSPYRCDAFPVKRHYMQMLKLDSLTLGDVQERARDLRLFKSSGHFPHNFTTRVALGSFHLLQLKWK